MELIRAEHTLRRHPEQDPGQRLLETGLKSWADGLTPWALGSTPWLSSHNLSTTGSHQHRFKYRPENPSPRLGNPWAQPPLEE